MKKHSISIRGHRTSFSLEEEFWIELKAIAAGEETTLSQLVTLIDAKRESGENLSSALRLHVLRNLKNRG